MTSPKNPGLSIIPAIITVAALSTGLTAARESASDVVIQPDGKIVAVGTSGFDFGVARYDSDGHLDPTFGRDGKITEDIAGGIDRGNAVALQGDGKILVAGQSQDSAGGIDFALVRFLEDGSLDPEFDVDGKTTTDFEGGFDDAASVAIQPDGKILVAGTANGSTAPNFCVARYHPDGSLDLDFGNRGRIITGGTSWARRVLVQPDGKILVGGSARSVDNRPAFGLVRYLSDGSLDPDFGNGGIVTTTFRDRGNAGLSDVIVFPDGKILAAGAENSSPEYWPSSSSLALARFFPDGTLDPDFGGDGKVIDRQGSAKRVFSQADGSILVVGNYEFFTQPTEYHHFAARYDAAGDRIIIPRTNDGPHVVTDPGGPAYTNGAALQTDGKIIVVGPNERHGRSSDFLVARFCEDNTLDPEFGGSGTVISDLDRYQPDLIIAQRRSRRVGDGVYNLTSAGQEIRLVSRTSGRSRFFFWVQNDGTDVDSIFLRATAGSRKCRVQYLQYRREGETRRKVRRDVTAEITGRRLTLPNVAALGEEQAQFEARLKFRRGTERRRFKALRVGALSQADTNRGDAVRATAFFRK